jgi:hypothetical protein|tara:strand:+ start:325 stop:498 length:174 start_codon:yes stop_codon:yes gene_type:complete
VIHFFLPHSPPKLSAAPAWIRANIIAAFRLLQNLLQRNRTDPTHATSAAKAVAISKA